MPFARITIAAADLDPSVTQALADDVTDLLRDALRKDPEVTVVSVQLVDPARWFVARRRPEGATGAHLEVSITAGTNSEEERATFLREAYALLGRRLGVLPEAVYVALYELDGRSYGYNGVSQHVRHAVSA